MTPTEVICTCVAANRKPEETQREWFKRWMCMHHWMETDYYQRKLKEEDIRFPIEDELRMKLG
jgi:hypothetical protein